MSSYYGECESKVACEPVERPRVGIGNNPNLVLSMEELTMLSCDMQARLGLVLEALIGRSDLIDERKATTNACEKRNLCGDFAEIVRTFGYCSKLLAAIQESLGID